MESFYTFLIAQCLMVGLCSVTSLPDQMWPFGGQVISVLLRQKRAPTFLPGVLILFLHGLWESQSAKLDHENTSPQINVNCAVLQKIRLEPHPRQCLRRNKSHFVIALCKNGVLCLDGHQLWLPLSSALLNGNAVDSCEKSLKQTAQAAWDNSGPTLGESPWTSVRCYQRQWGKHPLWLCSFF